MSEATEVEAAPGECDYDESGAFIACPFCFRLPDGGCAARKAKEADELLRAYSTALDEIYRLRKALAYEARCVEAHYEGYKTFPKSRRPHAEAQVERMRSLVRGEYPTHYREDDNWLRIELTRLRGSQTLTRYEWEAERGLRSEA